MLAARAMRRSDLGPSLAVSTSNAGRPAMRMPGQIIKSYQSASMYALATGELVAPPSIGSQMAFLRMVTRPRAPQRYTYLKDGAGN